MTLRGVRTKISGYFASALPVAGVLGYDIDPEMITQLLSNHGIPLICAQLLASIGVHHYRNKANIDSNSEQHVSCVENNKSLPEMEKSEISRRLDPVEEQVLKLSNGEFEDD